MATKEITVIDPDLFDALELSALAYGGIGAGRYFWRDSKDAESTPCCIVGHTVNIDAPGSTEAYNAINAVSGGDTNEGITANDEACHAINARKGADKWARVSWEEYIAERGWVRGS